MNRRNRKTKFALREMFRRVGLDYTWDEVRDYARDPKWYRKKVWSALDSQDFHNWLLMIFSGDFRPNMAVNMFMLQWGWAVEYEEGPCGK